MTDALIVFAVVLHLLTLLGINAKLSRIKKLLETPAAVKRLEEMEGNR